MLCMCQWRLYTSSFHAASSLCHHGLQFGSSRATSVQSRGVFACGPSFTRRPSSRPATLEIGYSLPIEFYRSGGHGIRGGRVVTGLWWDFVVKMSLSLLSGDEPGGASGTRYFPSPRITGKHIARLSEFGGIASVAIATTADVLERMILAWRSFFQFTQCLKLIPLRYAVSV